ncbi:MAG TPA: outer membrane beta-barrel protein [Gemmatimonadaceae bacterium]|nr:outer membrane beta-barrel protein [Gemmatimonadaceae bacterium]
MPRTLSTLLAATAALALAAAPAAAQRPQISLGGGATFPLDDLGDVQDAGWHGLVAMGYRPPLFPLGFRIDGMYHQLGGQGVGGVAAGDFRTIAVTGNVVLEAPALAVRPYVIGGVGLYNTKFEGAEGRSNVGFNAGVGLRFHLLDFDSFVEARYHTALDALGSTEDGRAARYVPVTFGISF